MRRQPVLAHNASSDSSCLQRQRTLYLAGAHSDLHRRTCLSCSTLSQPQRLHWAAPAAGSWGRRSAGDSICMSTSVDFIGKAQQQALHIPRPLRLAGSALSSMRRQLCWGQRRSINRQIPNQLLACCPRPGSRNAGGPTPKNSQCGKPSEVPLCGTRMRPSSGLSSAMKHTPGLQTCQC
jgi:hypothetical protein